MNKEICTTVPNVVLPWFLVSVQSGEHIHLNTTGGERWDTGKRGKGCYETEIRELHLEPRMPHSLFP